MKRSIQEWFAISALIAIVVGSIIQMIVEDFIKNLIGGIIYTIIGVIWWAIIGWLSKSRSTPVLALSWIMALISLLFTVFQVLFLTGLFNI